MYVLLGNMVAVPRDKFFETTSFKEKQMRSIVRHMYAETSPCAKK